ncbi:LysR family transcriptional regulator [Hasllibacter sp. MH4015]|uniref:LysR family transcriptional regulator n=1 Tax=Hasllibacter sp. MH4015 TaxID=2854029 RepID=UPI001CD418ED|nr:LysR family transcriptional regulator [Hasllibacter sp. MH4015]
MARPVSLDRAVNRLKLTQLRLLIAVGKHRAILHAAQELNISQPAATKMIKDVEADFDVRLFDRTNRGAIPTAHGRALIRHAQLIFAQLGNAAQEMKDLTDGATGRVVIGTLVAGSARLVPHAIGRVLAERPNVTIKVVEGTNEILMPRLRTGEIDMVVGRLPTHRHRRDLHQLALGEEKIHLLVGRAHPLAQRAGLSFDDLRPFGWILPPSETTLRRQIDEAFVEHDQYQPPVIVESVNYLTNRALLGQGKLIGLAPRQGVLLDIGTAMLVPLDFELPFGSGPIGATHRGADQLSPAAKVFLQALVDEAAA